MNIVITGASKGIGYEAALLFAQDKTNKIITISRSGFNSSESFPNITSINFDLRSDKFESELLPLILKQFNSVDILINNAGTLINKPFENLSTEDWNAIFQTNLFGALKLIRLLLPYMGKKNRSHMVNIASMGGFQGSVKFTGLSAYSSSKAALANLTECLAEEFREKNIAVNCLALGAVETEMFTKAFPGHKALVDAASMAKFLAEFSKTGHQYFNGKIIPVSSSTP